MGRFKKVTSILLAMVLIVTLFPPLLSVQANDGAPYISIESLPKNQNSPAEITTEYINVEVLYNNITDTNLSKLSYTVENVETGQLREGLDITPVRVGNQNKVVFNDVPLFYGLNKITIIYDSSFYSEPAWVRYTNTPSINLTINNQAFRNHDFIPKNTNTIAPNIVVDGTAANTNSVIGATTLSPEGLRLGVVSNRFSYVLGETGTQLRLRPGDNEFTVIASNDSREYSTERTFVYNNGRSFLFNTKIDTLTNLTTQEDMLFKQPSLQATTASSGQDFRFEIVTDIKINKSADNGLTHPTVTINGNTEIVLDPANAHPTESTNNFYIFKDQRFEVVIDKSKHQQVLDVVFTGPNADNHHQSFIYYYVNQHDPYVDRVEFKETGAPLYSGVEINIANTTNIDLLVYTGGQAPTGIKVEVRDPQSGASRVLRTYTDRESGAFLVKINRNDIPEGFSILTFIPVNGTTEYGSGAREYLINYNPTPYIYLTNIKQSYDKQIDLPTTINLRPVNIPSNEWTNIYVSLNNVGDWVNSGDIRTDLIEFLFRNRTGMQINNGINQITIGYYPSQNRNLNPIATYTYEFFFFDDNVPEVTKLVVPQSEIDNGKFVLLDGENYRYYTHETAYQVEGSFVNAHRLEFVARGYNSENQSTTTRWVFTRDSANRLVYNASESTRDVPQLVIVNELSDTYGAGTFYTDLINSQATGTHSFEVIATNGTGISNNRLIEIVREPATYIVHHPNIDSKTKVGTVNGNFARLYVEAEGADRIIYDKNKEVTEKRSVTIGNSTKEVFIFDVKGLKRGNNKVSFTVVRKDRQDNAEITLVNADTAIVGAQFKESISKNRIRAFNRNLELSFPKGTILKINNDRATDQHLSPDRDILVGIADPIDGRVNKSLNQNVPNFEYLFANPSDRFRPVSPLYWIDAGRYDGHAPNVNEALYGGGVYPYDRNQEFYTRNSSNYENIFVPSQPGELTIAYDSNIVSSGWRYVTVFHYGYDHTSKTYKWKNIGGVVNSKNNTITVPIQEFGYYRVMYMQKSYSDIIEHPWARNHLDTLFSKGIMLPKDAGRNLFSVADNITRGEFVSLLVKAFEIPLNYDDNYTFADITPITGTDGTYEYKYIETAARVGIVRGNSQSLFLPQYSITREDAAVMIARAANLKLETNNDRAKQQVNKLFTDLDRFSEYTISSVLAVNKAGYIEGKPNVLTGNGKPTFYFAPKETLTRAEAAAIVMRVMLKAKKIPSL